MTGEMSWRPTPIIVAPSLANSSHTALPIPVAAPKIMKMLLEKISSVVHVKARKKFTLYTISSYFFIDFRPEDDQKDRNILSRKIKI